MDYGAAASIAPLNFSLINLYNNDVFSDELVVSRNVG